MRVDLGTPVRCSDATLGELADIVIDPATRRIAPLVVEPRHGIAEEIVPGRRSHTG